MVGRYALYVDVAASSVYCTEAIIHKDTPPIVLRNTSPVPPKTVM